MEIGMKKEISFKVENQFSAKSMGSGGLEVLSTPTMIAFMEKASFELVEHNLKEGETTVGIKVDISHLHASLIDDTVTVSSELILIDNRRLVFHVKAYTGEVILGEGSHERFIVNSEKFMNKLKG